MHVLLPGGADHPRTRYESQAIHHAASKKAYPKYIETDV